MMKSGTFSKRAGAATKEFESSEFWFQVAFFNLNTVLYFLGCMYVFKKIIAKFRWHCISVWSLVSAFVFEYAIKQFAIQLLVNMAKQTYRDI